MTTWSMIPVGGTNSTTAIGNYFANTTATSINTIRHFQTTSTTQTSLITNNGHADTLLSGNLKVSPGMDLSIGLPDGAVLEVQRNGSYSIVDDQAKVTYKANNVREFNRYINGSDLLEEFIKFVSKQGQVSKSEFFNLPIELFIQWLVIRAAEADGEDHDYAPVIEAIPLALPNPNKRHSFRCKCCGKFTLKREFEFCSTDHLLKYSNKHSIFLDSPKEIPNGN